MVEKAEWEVVLDSHRREKEPSIWDLVPVLLGNGWRWKLAGTAALASLSLVFLAMLSLIGFLAFFVGRIAYMAFGSLKTKFGKTVKQSVGRH